MTMAMERAAVRYARELYAAMHKASKQYTAKQFVDLTGVTSTTSTGPKTVFIGSITSYVSELKIPARHYSEIRRLLVESGSIEFVRRGSKNSPSIIILHHDLPDEEELPKALTPAVSGGRMKAIEQRLAALEGWQDALGKGELNVIEVIRNHEARLLRLEKK